MENNGPVQTIRLPPPSLMDNTADADRLVREIKKRLQTGRVFADTHLLKRLPFILRDCGYAVDCILAKDVDRWDIVGIVESSEKQPPGGLAVDLGTTRISMRIVNLATGDVMAETSFDNPQISIGPDILTRVRYCETDDGMETATGLLTGAMNREIENLARRAGLAPDDLYLAALAGNTTMTHLFMGINPYWMIREPYIPVINTPGMRKAADFGLNMNPSARILIFPNVGSYFGGDLIAGVMYSGMDQSEDVSLLVDVGTNAEVVLGNDNWLIACAGAAGPALEGGVTQMGMTAGPGVIDSLKIDPDTKEFKFNTLSNAPPIGICGSGLIDLAAQLFLSGMMDIRGRLDPAACGDRIENIDGLNHLVVVPKEISGLDDDLRVTQADMDSLIRSKAAMYTILETIVTTVGLSLSDISKLYIAGTFGTFIDPASAIAIGMIPDLPVDRFVSIGNSSLEGATLALKKGGFPEIPEAVKNRITYMELNVNQDFMNRFSAAKFIPHTDPARFPSVQKGTPGRMNGEDA